MRGRELKSIRSSAWILPVPVRPHARAGVEIILAGVLSLLTRFALMRGRELKYAPPKPPRRRSSVRPHARAGVEITAAL